MRSCDLAARRSRAADRHSDESAGWRAGGLTYQRQGAARFRGGDLLEELSLKHDERLLLSSREVQLWLIDATQAASNSGGHVWKRIKSKRSTAANLDNENDIVVTKQT